MRWIGLRLSVTLLTVIPLRGPVPPTSAQTGEAASPQAADTASLQAGATADASYSSPRAAGTSTLVVPAPATVAAAMAWAPAIGLLLGIIPPAVLLVVDHPPGAGPLTRPALAVASLAFLSRGLHLDGLADLADGLVSGRPAPAPLA